MNNRARILLSDDHELFRAGLASLINLQSDMEVIGEGGDGLEALTLARDLKPDLIIMDINMPMCDGLEATRLIRLADPDARIIILTVHDEDDKLFEAIKSGACGYILKDTSSGDFLHQVRDALKGGAPMSPRLAARMLEEFARLTGSRPATQESELNQPIHDILTSREREILAQITLGASDKEIAQKLSVSLYTVKSHVRSILSKLHASTRHEAAHLARMNRLNL